MASKKFETMLQLEMAMALHSNTFELFDFISTLEAAAMSAKQLAMERVDKEQRANFARGLVVSQLKSFFEVVESDEKNILPYADYINRDKVFADFAKDVENNLPQDADDFEQALFDALKRFLEK